MDKKVPIGKAEALDKKVPAGKAEALDRKVSAGKTAAMDDNKSKSNNKSKNKQAPDSNNSAELKDFLEESYSCFSNNLNALFEKEKSDYEKVNNKKYIYKDFAKLMDIAPSTLSNYLNNTQRHTYDFLLRLKLRYPALKLDDLFFGDISYCFRENTLSIQEQADLNKFSGTYYLYYYDTNKRHYNNYRAYRRQFSSYSGTNEAGEGHDPAASGTTHQYSTAPETGHNDSWSGQEYTPIDSDKNIFSNVEIRYAVMRIDIKQVNGALPYAACCGLFGIDNREDADRIKALVEKCSDSEEIIPLLEKENKKSIYTGSLEISQQHLFFSLHRSTDVKDSVLMIFNKPRINNGKYFSGLGTVNSISTGRESDPIVQLIALSGNPAYISDEEIKSFLLFSPLSSR